MRVVFIPVFIFLILLPFSVSATTYYVSTAAGCSDSGPGTQLQPWCTISEVNNRIFNPGDKILFKRGEIWREQLNVPSPGNSTDQITFGAYGTGEKPRIFGSEQITGWTVYSGNQWRAACSSHPGGGDNDGPVWFVNTSNDGKIHWGKEETSLLDVDAEYDWYWEGGYLYVYSPSDPDTRYDSVEAAWRWHSIRSSWNRHYITIENIHGAFTARQGINDPYSADYWIIDNCYIHHSGCDCPTGWAADNLKWEGEGWWIKNNVMHDGRAHNIQHFSTGSTGDIIEGNIFYNAGHASIDCKHIGSSGTTANQIIRYNLVYMTDDYAWPSASNSGIYVQADECYCMVDAEIYNNIVVDFWSSGIHVAYMCDGVKIYNNVVHNKHPLSGFEGRGINTFGPPSQGPINLVIKNNIISGDMGTNGYGLTVYWPSSIAECDYNNFYITNGYYANYNQLTRIYGASDWEAWKSDTGLDTHSLWNVNPQFVSSSLFDFHLQSTSPCIDNGTDVGLTVDFEGTPIPQGNGTDIGAYEYDFGSPPSNCTGTCKTNPCDTYDDCANGTGTCVTGYCCSGACSLCPNGNCESGETCSSCPSDCACVSPQLCCNDQCITPACSQESDCGTNPCKVYSCSNPGTCSASCSSQDITSCTNDDGCCPAGCDEGNDNDCGGLGPVALYHFDEGFGTNASDSSVNGNDGTINGATWTNDSVSGNALDFDGVNDYVDCGSNDTLSVDYPTVSLWLKADTLQDNVGLVAKGDGGNRQYWIWVYQDSLSLEIDGGGYNNYLHSLQADRWYHLAITYNGSNIVIYVNGTEVNNIAQSTGTILTDDDPLIIGRLPNFQYFDGKIDEVRIYDRVLTPDEIFQLYNNPAGVSVPGDINGDGKVNIDDLVAVGIDFGKISNFVDPDCDTNSDGEVDIFDVVFVASRFT